MSPLKLRILNQFGVAQALCNPDEIEVAFPSDFDTLVKRMSFGYVKIINDKKGELEVTLTPFDIQGLKTGRNQNLQVNIILGDKTRTAIFERILNVETEMVEGEERKVIVK